MKKLAVHMHIHYVEQLKEMMEYLRSLCDIDYDLFVTLTKQNSEITDIIKKAYPYANIRTVPNNGYDIGPFIDFLHTINLDEYEYVLKIHTKGKTSQNYTWLNGHRLNNRLWRQMLLDALLKDENRVKNNLQMMDDTPQIGMIGSQYCVTDDPKNYQKLLPQIKEALNNCGFADLKKIEFVAGTMFWVRAKLLKPLLRYSIKDFEKTDGTVKEGTFAHVMERLFGALVAAQGFQIKRINHDNYTWPLIKIAVMHFLYQKKQSPQRTLIKICKIPVYSKNIKDN